ncbi:MAG: TRAP transporter small permease subunit [Rhodospirillales bacterium]
MLARLTDGLEAVVVRIGRIAAWAGLALVLVTVFDVAARGVTQSAWAPLRALAEAQQQWFGSTKLQELEWHLHTVLFALCLGYAYLRGAHVRIDLVRERMGACTRLWVEVAGIVLFLLPFCAVVLWFGAGFVARSFADGEMSASAAGLGQRWIIKGVLVAGFALLGLAGVATLARTVRRLRGG